jgi:PAS domain S-box-containing protein
MTLKNGWTYRWTDLPWLAGTAAVCALLAKIVLTFYSTNGLVAVFWPGSGVALAVLLLGGRRFWAGIYVGSLAGQLWAGESPGVAALISLGSVLEPLLGAWLLSRKSDFDVSLRSPRDFFRLCYLGAALSPVICTLIGVGTLLLSGRIPANDFWHEFAHWWMGDTLGIVVVAPIIMVWRQLPRARPWHGLEAVALFGLSFLVGQILFFDWFHDAFSFVHRSYWMYLVVSWAAVRLGRHGVLLIILMATLQALVGAAQGLGSFGNDLARTQLLNFWAYTMIVATVGTSLAIAFSERERIAAELRSSENRYGSLFENMLDGLAHCRMIFRDGVPVDYEYITVNPAFEKVTGLKDVVGRKMSEIIPGYARDNQISLETFSRVARTGEPVRWEHYLAALDKWFSFAAYRPAVGEFVTVMENITERKRVEDELRKLSLAVEQSPVSIVITDLDGRIEYVNPAFSLASGYSAAEALGQNPRILKSGRTPPEAYEELWATLGAGKVWRGEFINRSKDGTDYLEVATISPIRQADGPVTHYVAVKDDITELKQTMDKLQSSEDRLRLAKAAAGLGIYDRDIASSKLVWDERARYLWGVGPDEPITYATFMAGVHPDDRAATQAAITQSLNPLSTGEYYAEYRVISRVDGSVRHVAANGQAFFEDGRAVRFVGTLKDITAQKRLEQEIREQRSEMELLVKQQVAAQTAAAIAHELNQPLVSISAYSEAALRMLRGGTKSPEKLARALEGAMQQSQRAGRTLHDLLDFLHKGDTASELVDLTDVVLDALAIAEESGYGGFRPVLELERNLPPVLANRLQLQKVLVNLLHNGVDAMRGAGASTVAITITVRTTEGSNMAQVTVQDSGPGIDAETAHRIFEPFFTTKTVGTGLGLAISRALIEAHGGQMWADLETVPGATFHFTLPFAS